MTTGQKIQALRKGRGLTQEQLAARLGVSRQAVSRWELDETLPDTQNLLPLKEALGVSIDTLLDSTRGLEEPAPQAGLAPAAASLSARAVAVPAAVLLLLVVYFLVWGIRYFQRHTRPPQ